MTIKYKKPTQSLTKPITDRLTAATSSDQPAEIGRVLNQLRDGDVLVLALHSDPTVFGLGNAAVDWSEFWTTFGVANPPRLAAVIVGGCMAARVDGDEYEPISEAQTETLRGIFGADVVFCPRGVVHKNVAINDTNGLLGSLQDGKKLGDLDLQGRWQYKIDPKWTKKDGTLPDITLADLRTGIPIHEAYEAGIAAGKSPTNVRESYDKYNDHERTAKAFREGFLEGRKLKP